MAAEVGLISGLNPRFKLPNKPFSPPFQPHNFALYTPRKMSQEFRVSANLGLTESLLLEIVVAIFF